jgi:hypothetical protein
MPFYERLWLAVWPPARRRYENRTREVITWLVAHPEEPVEFE